MKDDDRVGGLGGVAAPEILGVEKVFVSREGAPSAIYNFLSDFLNCFANPLKIICIENTC